MGLENNISGSGHGLEKLVSTVKSQTKSYLVDTSANLISGTLLFGASEYFIAGLSGEEILKARVGMGLATFVYARPFGAFRDYWSKCIKSDANSSKLRKYLTDVSASVMFFVPLYSSVLYMSGVSGKDIAYAVGGGMLTSILTSRPQGWFLDKWRTLCGTKPALG